MHRSARTCAFTLLFLIYTNVQFCKAYWWLWSEEKFSTPEECARECRDGEPPKTCYYQFILERYVAYGKACDFCEPPLNDSRINPKCACIISDGYEKMVFSINRSIPGPSIQVCRDDKIVVDVINNAEGISASIHWHGIFQKGSQYYDGVPYVTQCPILASNTFRYKFCVGNSGTHFYHSHIAEHIIDGQYGSLIVRDSPKNNPHRKLYDKDLPEHVCVISDLFHKLSLDYYPGRSRKNTGEAAENFLINGRGNWKDPVTGKSSNITLSTFVVKANTKYRFRVINACGTVCPIKLSIQNHTMQIIATDGKNVKPILADAIIMFTGERYDIVIHANQTPRQYWIYVQGLGECKTTGIYQLATLIYQDNSKSPSSRPEYSDLSQIGGRIFNPLNSTNCKDDLCVVQTCLLDEKKMLLNSIPNRLLILPFSFFDYSSSLQNLFNNTGEKFIVGPDRAHIISMIDNITYTESSAPLISQTDGYKYMCGDHNTPATCTAPCACTHVYFIPLNTMVDVMIYDEKPRENLYHPFHLHGYDFCVLRMGQFENATNKKYISKSDVKKVVNDYKNDLQKGSYKCCAPKDTVTIPNTGYVIFRFFANNPGWWLFHCHFSWHTSSGMNVVFRVGDEYDLPPVPPNFPKCYNWTPK